MGLLDTLLGRTKPVKPDLDALFALPSAAVGLQASLGLTPTGVGSVCVKPAEGGGFAGLREQIVFAQHNIATDASFNECHLVVARNVMTHFTRALAYRAHQVVYESLVRLGYLGLSSKESLRYTPHQRAYEELADTERFYRRMR